MELNHGIETWDLSKFVKKILKRLSKLSFECFLEDSRPRLSESLNTLFKSLLKK